ncbi:SDR family NAD(P)-dependent oxidoreductase [Asticcacaulis solisilvae]|uniref:SDR family NAD(P)-dependent oxidoreductase n=1 Tax=Asticcacaulis solisilvae TaxID=1217274 RepID=UPI003FD86E81
MSHPALQTGNHAIVTGGASGIGLAIARRFVEMELNVTILDRDAARIAATIDYLTDSGRPGVDVAITGHDVDVSDREAVARFAQSLTRPVDVLVNNAAISPPTSALDGAGWQAMLDVNLWGVIHGTQAFAPAMVARGTPGLIVNTGSKQGITTPPGNPAYNVAKAGVKAFTEALQHELRNGSNPAVTAHLLIPGFVWTGLTRGDRTEKPAGAWDPEQVADFMLESLGRGDFYILCPDNDVSRALDEKRMAWAIGDIIENRPPLSRWHPDYAEAFKAYLGS